MAVFESRTNRTAIILVSWSDLLLLLHVPDVKMIIRCIVTTWYSDLLVQWRHIYSCSTHPALAWLNTAALSHLFCCACALTTQNYDKVTKIYLQKSSEQVSGALLIQIKLIDRLVESGTELMSEWLDCDIIQQICWASWDELRISETMAKIDVKVVMLGKEFSGKTSLVERFLNERFSGDNRYQATIGAAYGARWNNMVK